METLIVGFGVIGKQVGALDHRADIFDPKLNYAAQITKEYDIAFICVPTEEKDGKLDTSIVLDCITGLKNSKCIVVKSTVSVGFCDDCNDDRVIFSPEFTGSTKHVITNPDWTIIAGGSIEAQKLYARWLQDNHDPNHKICYSDYKTAELVKLMDNCYLATKVSFCLEFAKIAKAVNIDYNKLRQLFLMDPRIGATHTDIKEDQTTWSSHCLNKDTAEVAYNMKSDFMKYVREHYMEIK